MLVEIERGVLKLTAQGREERKSLEALALRIAKGGYSPRLSRIYAAVHLANTQGYDLDLDGPYVIYQDQRYSVHPSAVSRRPARVQYS